MHFVHDSDDYKWAATCHHACINLVLHFANRRFTSPWLFGNLGCCNMLHIFFKILTAAVSSELQFLCATQVCQKRRTRRRCSMLQQTSHPWNSGYAILPYETLICVHCKYSRIPLSQFRLVRPHKHIQTSFMTWSILTTLHGSVACGFLRPSAMDKQKSELKSVDKKKSSQSSLHSNRAEDNIVGGKVWNAFCNTSWFHHIDLLHFCRC